MKLDKPMQAELKPGELADTHTVIAISGSLDMLGAEYIEPEFIANTVDRKRHALVDLSAVDFLGSMGIRLFLSAAKGLLRDQKRLVLFGANPSVQRTLEVAGFTSIIAMVPTLDAARGKIGL